MSSKLPRLAVQGLTVELGGTTVLGRIDLDLLEGEFVAVLGRNGSGKTTLLRAIAGFQPISSGSIRLDGRELRDVAAHRRGIGLLFQEPALFPRWTVAENVAYGLEIAGRPEAEIARTVDRMLGLLHLGALAERRPEALSGGERQRVALARTLAPGPSVVLLDEPFASVDPELRAGLRAEFRSALRSLGTSAVHVTHDRDEGLVLGDRVVVLDEGRIVRSGRPMEVFGAPRTARTARFLGYNILSEGSRTLAIEPRDVELAEAGDGLPATVEVIAAVPGGTTIALRTPSGDRIFAFGELPEGIRSPGQSVVVRWRRAVEVEPR